MTAEMDTDPITPSLIVSYHWPEIGREMEAAVTSNSASAWVIRAELAREGHLAPFYIAVLDEHNIHVRTVPAGGDIRQAKRRLADENYKSSGRAFLTDSNGKAIQ